MVYLIDGVDKMLQLEDFRITDNLGVTGYTRVPQSTLGLYSTSGTVVPAVRCGSDTYVGYGGGIWALPTSIATTQLPSRILQASTCQGLPPVKGRIDSKIFVRALDSPVVYILSDGSKHAISSWSRLMELNQGGSPIIVEYSRSALESIPVGSPA